MDQPSPAIVNCPHCGVANFAIDTDCVECGKGLTIYIGPKPKFRRVTYGSAMMVIATVAVCLAPVRDAPGLSVVFALILIPATTRAILHIEGRKADGRPMIITDKVLAYVNSTAIMIAILVVASVAFVVTCAPTGFILMSTGMDMPGLIVAFIAGTVSALFVIYHMGRRLWPRKD